MTPNGGVVNCIAVDCAGSLYVGTADAAKVFDFAGQALGNVATGYASNCTFGGADRRTFYVTSQDTLKAIRLNVSGLPD